MQVTHYGWRFLLYICIHVTVGKVYLRVLIIYVYGTAINGKLYTVKVCTLVTTLTQLKKYAWNVCIVFDVRYVTKSIALLCIRCILLFYSVIVWVVA